MLPSTRNLKLTKAASHIAKLNILFMQNRRSILLTLLLSFVLFNTSLAATWFVTPSGNGSMDGSSWNNAAPGTDFQAIIDNAMPNDEVWVACGTYLPTTTLDRNISFHQRNGVAIYGGFQGNEIALSERNINCGPCSILSGEIGNPGEADNSYTVMYNADLDSTAILDGFTIRDGNDDRSPTSAGNGLGGGLYNHGFNPLGFCHPTIRNCIFTNNRASWGAGAFNNAYNGGDTRPTYANCIFHHNHAYIEAGGMDTYAVGGNGAPTVINSIFYENTSATNVGAMYAWGGNAGGSCTPTLINCVFANNSAQNGYGGAFIADALDESGGTSSGFCRVTLHNCIVWQNSATGTSPQFYVRGSNAEVVATYSDISLTGQSGDHVLTGSSTGNIDVVPMFMDIMDGDGPDDCWFTEDDGLRLDSSSTCIDAGDSTMAYSSDLAGADRVVGGNVDMGAYEWMPSTMTAISQPELTFQLFPNPASERVHLAGLRGREEQVEVVNSLGQVVLRAIDMEQLGRGHLRFSLETLKSGLYIVRVGGMSKKLLVE